MLLNIKFYTEWRIPNQVKCAFNFRGKQNGNSAKAPSHQKCHAT